MKKLMIAAAIVCAAAMSQAASVNWQAAVCEQDGTTAVKADQVVLLAWSATQGELASKIESATIGTIADNGYEVVGSYKLTEGDATDFAFSASSPFTRTNADGGVNGYYQMLLISDDGKSFAVADVGSVAGITDSTGAGMINYNKTWDNYDDFVGNSGYIGTVAPEPTSGLLLLLGVAGLALKRKRA